MNIKSIFCNHNWKSHSKEKYEWDEKRIVNGTEYWIKPVIQDYHIEETVEILICDNCGKIQKIYF